MTPLTNLADFSRKTENGVFQISSFASLIVLGSSGLLLRVSGTLWGVSCWPFGLCLGYLGSVLVALGLLLGVLGFVLGATWSSWVSLGAFCGSLQGSLGHFVAASGWTWLLLAAFNCLWAALGPLLVASLLSVSWPCLGLSWFYNVSFENLDKR